jgi:hypothetical protein
MPDPASAKTKRQRFWDLVARGLLYVGTWAAEHPDKAIAIIKAFK